jgi:oligopeptide transport system permease protein
MDTKDQRPDTGLPGALHSETPLMPPPPELLDTPGFATIPVEPEVKVSGKTLTPFQESLLRFRRDRRAMISLGVVIFIVLVALFGPFIYQHIGGSLKSVTRGVVGPEVYHTFTHTEFGHREEGPSALYWLGTDKLGRDMLARLMQGVLVSMLVAGLVEIVDILLGVTIGVLAGYFGGWIDQLLARFTDLMFAFPGLLFVILLSAIFGSQADVVFRNVPILGQNGNSRLLLVAFALSFTVWPMMARYVRGQTLQLKHQQFVEAARTAGSSDIRIIFSHIIPNLSSIVVIASTLNISNVIISEAGISLLGFGVQPPGASLGLMISEGATILDTHPWQSLLPTIVLAIIVLAFSFIGDGLRDAFDPRTKD